LRGLHWERDFTDSCLAPCIIFSEANII
jgi:hypothetical protein